MCHRVVGGLDGDGAYVRFAGNCNKNAHDVAHVVSGSRPLFYYLFLSGCARVLHAACYVVREACVPACMHVRISACKSVTVRACVRSRV